jgi:TPR repeat protein
MIRDYFDLTHLNARDPATERLKTAVANLRAGELVPEAIARLGNLTESRNPDAAFILGTIHEFGLFGRPPNSTLARPLYARGANGGSPECRDSLAFLMRYGIGGPRDAKQAAALIAQNRDASVWSTLRHATAHRIGGGRRRRCDAAYRELEPLAEAVVANTSGLRKFGNAGVRLFPNGSLPGSRDRERAAQWEMATIAAGQGHSEAHIRLGRLCLESRPPDRARAKAHFREAGEAGVADGLLLLYLLEREESVGPDAGDRLGGYLKEAAALGSVDAATEIARLQLESTDSQTREFGAQNLNQSVEARGMEALYLLGLELANGRPPFARNISRARELFQICFDHGHHAALFQLAALLRKVDTAGDHGCEAALVLLVAFLEKSFLFDDAELAFDALGHGEIEYALRIYQRLADIGSQTAAAAAEMLVERLGGDPAPWQKLQGKKPGKSVPRKEGANPTHATPAESFRLAWMKRNESWPAAERHFKDAASQSAGELPVTLARLWCFMEKLPIAIGDWWNGRKTADLDFVRGVVGVARNGIIGTILLVLLYLLIGLRVRMFCKQRQLDAHLD